MLLNIMVFFYQKQSLHPDQNQLQLKGVLYSENMNLCWGVLEKMFTIDDIAYCIISKLTPLTDQLCHNTTTTAQLHKHYIACQPLRFA